MKREKKYFVVSCSLTRNLCVDKIELVATMNAGKEIRIMPKKYSAFALRHFDDKRILDRVCKMNSGIEDVTVLNNPINFSVRNFDGLKLCIDAYAGKLIRHQARLMRYFVLLLSRENHSEKQSDKIARVSFLIDEYDKIFSSLSRFKELIVVYLDTAKEKYSRDKFSMRLKQARREAGLTQIQLAAELGMKQSGYSSYENSGSEPSLATLTKISRVLKRSTDWLLGLTP